MTDFETYIINLKKDVHKFYDIKNKLSKVNIIPHRFDAIYGKEITVFDEYNDFISTYCKYFCPKGTIGCGLSHYKLLYDIYIGKVKGKNDKFTLILEDDVTPLFKEKSEIVDIINYIPFDCDILLLHCMGECPYDDKIYDDKIYDELNMVSDETELNPYIKSTSENYINISAIYKKPISRLFGSTAAYLVRNDAIPKILKIKLGNHVDMQMYNTMYDTVYIYYKQLFYTDDSSSDVNETNYNTKGLKQIDYHFPSQSHNLSTSRKITYPIIRIPLIDVTISTYNILQFVIVLILLICIYYTLFEINKKDQYIKYHE